MSNNETQEKENFNIFTCEFEEFKQFLLSQHIIINDPEFEELKHDVLDSIIEYEKSLDWDMIILENLSISLLVIEMKKIIYVWW